MRDRHFGLRDKIGEFQSQSVDGFDAVVEKEDLAAALELAQDRIANQALVVAGHVGLNRQPVHRRRLDDTQVTDAHQRHMQRARDRRRRETQDIDQLAEFFEPLLMHDAEAVLFVDDHEAQVFELDVFLQQAVRTDNDIYLPFGRVLQHLSDFFGCQKTADHLYADGMIAEAMAKSL